MFLSKGFVIKGMAVIVLAVAALLASGCGGPAERIKERANITPEPTPTPGERDISGSLQVEGTASGGLNPYHGALSVTPSGDVYSFKWSTTKGSLAGTGVQYGNAAAVSTAKTGGGKGCGVVLYKILPGGKLDGRTVQFGASKFGIEKAEQTEGTTFVGKYSVTGTTADGQPYSGTINVVKEGDGYDFEWNTDKKLVGFAIWRGSTAAVTFGGSECGFALYDISGSGNLDGFWGGKSELTFGKESAKRQ